MTWKPSHGQQVAAALIDEFDSILRAGQNPLPRVYLHHLAGCIAHAVDNAHNIGRTAVHLEQQQKLMWEEPTEQWPAAPANGPVGPLRPASNPAIPTVSATFSDLKIEIEKAADSSGMRTAHENVAKMRAGSDSSSTFPGGIIPPPPTVTVDDTETPFDLPRKSKKKAKPKKKAKRNRVTEVELPS